MSRQGSREDRRSAQRGEGWTGGLRRVGKQKTSKRSGLRVRERERVVLWVRKQLQGSGRTMAFTGKGTWASVSQRAWVPRTALALRDQEEAAA
jgi:hypothetical protein